MKFIKTGEIPYAKKRQIDDATYSIDRMTIDVLFAPDPNLFGLLRASLDLHGIRHGAEMFDQKKFKIQKRIYQWPHFHVEIWEAVNRMTLVSNDMDEDGEIDATNHTRVIGDPQPVMRLDWNPNKIEDTTVIDAVMGFLASRRFDFTWIMKRVDYALDLPGQIREYYVLSRKTESFYKTTRYYGVRGSDGQLKVYDKRQEILDKDHAEIGREVTRFEWTQRENVDLAFHFDTICRMTDADLPGSAAKALKYIQPEQINTYLADLHRSTRKSIKEQAFAPLSFDAQLFRVLLDEYLDHYGLPRDQRRMPIPVLE